MAEEFGHASACYGGSTSSSAAPAAPAPVAVATEAPAADKAVVASALGSGLASPDHSSPSRSPSRGSPPHSHGGSGTSVRLRLMRAFAQADEQADAVARRALEALDRWPAGASRGSNGSSTANGPAGANDDGLAEAAEAVAALLGSADSTDGEEEASALEEGADEAGDTFAIALERRLRRQVRIAALRRRSAELRGQGEAYKRKEDEFIQQLDQLFWDKENEAGEMRVQAEALEEERTQMRDRALQQDLEHDALQTQLDEMTAYKEVGEARVAALMDHLVTLLGRGDITSSPDSKNHGRQLLDTVLADTEAHCKYGDERLNVFLGQLEEARRENRARAQRLSDMQIATTGIHTRMCQLQTWILNQKLSPQAGAAPPSAQPSASASASGAPSVSNAMTESGRSLFAEASAPGAATASGRSLFAESVNGGTGLGQSWSSGLGSPGRLGKLWYDEDGEVEAATSSPGRRQVAELALSSATSPPGSCKVVKDSPSSQCSGSPNGNLSMSLGSRGGAEGACLASLPPLPLEASQRFGPGASASASASAPAPPEIPAAAAAAAIVAAASAAATAEAAARKEAALASAEAGDSSVLSNGDDGEAQKGELHQSTFVGSSTLDVDRSADEVDESTCSFLANTAGSIRLASSSIGPGALSGSGAGGGAGSGGGRGPSGGGGGGRGTDEAALASIVEKGMFEALTRVKFSHFVFRVTGRANTYKFGSSVYAVISPGPDGRLIAFREGAEAGVLLDDLLAELQAEASTSTSSPSAPHGTSSGLGLSVGTSAPAPTSAGCGSSSSGFFQGSAAARQPSGSPFAAGTTSSEVPPLPFSSAGLVAGKLHHQPPLSARASFPQAAPSSFGSAASFASGAGGGGSAAAAAAAGVARRVSADMLLSTRSGRGMQPNAAPTAVTTLRGRGAASPLSRHGPEAASMHLPLPPGEPMAAAMPSTAGLQQFHAMGVAGAGGSAALPARASVGGGFASAPSSRSPVRVPLSARGAGSGAACAPQRWHSPEAGFHGPGAGRCDSRSPRFPSPPGACATSPTPSSSQVQLGSPPPTRWVVQVPSVAPGRYRSTSPPTGGGIGPPSGASSSSVVRLPMGGEHRSPSSRPFDGGASALVQGFHPGGASVLLRGPSPTPPITTTYGGGSFTVAAPSPSRTGSAERGPAGAPAQCFVATRALSPSPSGSPPPANLVGGRVVVRGVARSLSPSGGSRCSSGGPPSAQPSLAPPPPPPLSGAGALGALGSAVGLGLGALGGGGALGGAAAAATPRTLTPPPPPTQLSGSFGGFAVAGVPGARPWPSPPQLLPAPPLGAAVPAHGARHNAASAMPSALTVGAAAGMSPRLSLPLGASSFPAGAQSQQQQPRPQAAAALSAAAVAGPIDESLTFSF